jgi:hypothetical protein
MADRSEKDVRPHPDQLFTTPQNEGTQQFLSALLEAG